jgi:hypothetical protein
MVDATQPATAVESLDTEALESTLGDIFGDNEEGAEGSAQNVKEAEGQPDEVSADDLPDDEPAPAGDADAFEIVHNGQPVKLTREQTVELARQGFDYTQKTQAVAEMRRQSEAILQRAAEVEQIMPIISRDLATIQALETQLRQYANVDWVGLASNDPLEYPKVKAQYDQLVQGYNAATQQFQQRAQSVMQERQNIAAYQLQWEAQRLTQLVPEWSEPAKFQAGAQELRSYLLHQGAHPSVVDGLSDALSVSIARKAMLYDKLKAQKDAKSKQLRGAPPVVKPGAVSPSSEGKAGFVKARQDFKRAGRAGQSKTQERILEGLLSKTFK